MVFDVGSFKMMTKMVSTWKQRNKWNGQAMQHNVVYVEPWQREVDVDRICKLIGFGSWKTVGNLKLWWFGIVSYDNLKFWMFQWQTLFELCWAKMKPASATMPPASCALHIASCVLYVLPGCLAACVCVCCHWVRNTNRTILPAASSWLHTMCHDQ